MSNRQIIIVLFSLVNVISCSFQGLNQKSRCFYNYMYGVFNEYPEDNHLYVVINSNSCRKCVNEFVNSVNNVPFGSFPNVVIITTSKALYKNLRSDLGLKLLLDENKIIDNENLNLYNISCIRWGSKGILSINQVENVNDLLKILKSTNRNSGK